MIYEKRGIVANKQQFLYKYIKLATKNRNSLFTILFQQRNNHLFFRWTGSRR